MNADERGYHSVIVEGFQPGARYFAGGTTLFDLSLKHNF